MYVLREKPYDIVIQNGRVLDVMTGFDQETDIGITGRMITKIGKIRKEDAKTIVNAAGHYVTPGLTDYHCHVYYGGDWASLPAEVYAPQSGITTLVDAGSAGCGGFPLFRSNVIEQSLLTVKAYLFIGTGGQVGLGCVEDENPAHINEAGIVEMCERYPNDIVGIKLKVDRDHVQTYGLEPLRAAIALGEKTGLRVSVHATDPAAPVAEILDMLRKGDIFCHMYHDMGEGILDQQGNIRQCVRSARERGVLFDAAHGKTNNFSLSVAEKAIDQGFLPDIISSDYTQISLHARYSFVKMLTEYLYLGMNFQEILCRCIKLPQQLLGNDEALIAEGKIADLAIFAIEDRPTELWDFYGNQRCSPKRISTKMTIKEGMFLFDQLEQ